MMRLAEYRSKSALLADFLPWAALIETPVGRVALAWSTIRASNSR